jgi:hypothetical protein
MIARRPQLASISAVAVSGAVAIDTHLVEAAIGRSQVSANWSDRRTRRTPRECVCLFWSIVVVLVVQIHPSEVL